MCWKCHPLSYQAGPYRLPGSTFAHMWHIEWRTSCRRCFGCKAFLSALPTKCRIILRQENDTACHGQSSMLSQEPSAPPLLSRAYPARTRIRLNPCTISATSSLPGSINELSLSEAKVKVTFKYAGSLPSKPPSLFP